MEISFSFLKKVNKKNRQANNFKEIGAFKLVKVRVKKAKMKAKSVVLHPSLVLSALTAALWANSARDNRVSQSFSPTDTKCRRYVSRV